MKIRKDYDRNKLLQEIALYKIQQRDRLTPKSIASKFGLSRDYFYKVMKEESVAIDKLIKDLNVLRKAKG